MGLVTVPFLHQRAVVRLGEKKHLEGSPRIRTVSKEDRQGQGLCLELTELNRWLKNTHVRKERATLRASGTIF